MTMATEAVLSWLSWFTRMDNKVMSMQGPAGWCVLSRNSFTCYVLVVFGARLAFQSPCDIFYSNICERGPPDPMPSALYRALPKKLRFNADNFNAGN